LKASNRDREQEASKSLQAYLSSNEELDASEVMTDASGYIIEPEAPKAIDPDSLTSEAKVLESLESAYDDECDVPEEK
jgi:hypothetical protein